MTITTLLLSKQSFPALGTEGVSAGIEGHLYGVFHTDVTRHGFANRVTSFFSDRFVSIEEKNASYVVCAAPQRVTSFFSDRFVSIEEKNASYVVCAAPQHGVHQGLKCSGSSLLNNTQ
jgi:hypothetical protein